MEPRRPEKSRLRRLICGDFFRHRHSVSLWGEDFRGRSHEVPRSCCSVGLSALTSREVAARSPYLAGTSVDGVTTSPEVAVPSPSGASLSADGATTSREVAAPSASWRQFLLVESRLPGTFRLHRGRLRRLLPIRTQLNSPAARCPRSAGRCRSCTDRRRHRLASCRSRTAAPDAPSGWGGAPSGPHSSH